MKQARFRGLLLGLVFVACSIVALPRNAIAQSQGGAGVVVVPKKDVKKNSQKRAKDGLEKSETAFVSIAVAAVRMRSDGVVDSQRIQKSINDPTSREGLDLKLPDITDPEEEAALWSNFFRSTQIFFGGSQSSAPVIGFYSPTMNYWLMTKWKTVKKVPRIITARLYSGESFVSSKPTTLSSELFPEWMVRGTSVPFHEALQKQTAQSARRFAALYPISGKAVFDLPRRKNDEHATKILFRDRAISFVSNLSAIHAVEDILTIYEATLVAVEHENKNALQILSASDDVYKQVAAVLKLSKHLRSSLIPLVSYESENSLFILSSRIDEARFVLISEFGENDGKIGLTGIAYLDAYAKAPK